MHTDSITTQIPEAMSEVSLSAHDVSDEPLPPPSSDMWTPEEIRKAIDVIADKVVCGELDDIGMVASLEKLVEESHWKKQKTVLRARLIQTIKQRRSRSQSERDTKATIPEEDNLLAVKLAMHPNLFLRHQNALKTLGFPVRPRVADSILMSLTARLLPNSTAHINYGASSSGKSAVVLAALNLLPAGLYEIITSMSTQAAYYMGDLKRKVIVMGEIKPLKEGEDDEKQMTMRQLISENKVTRKIPEKQPDGTIKIVDKTTEGPCSIITSTTMEPQSFNDELVNRGYWIKSDDSEETTARALKAKAQNAMDPTKMARMKVSRDTTVRAWQALNASLEPLPVVIPFAEKVIPKNSHVTVRRLYELLLDYVRCSALLHQHSRKKVERGGVIYLIAEAQDYKIAAELLKVNGPRTLENCSEPARESLKRAQLTFSAASPFTQEEASTKLGIPRATIQRHIQQWISDGQAEEQEVTGYKRQKRYILTNSTSPSGQDLGIVDFETAFPVSA